MQCLYWLNMMLKILLAIWLIIYVLHLMLTLKTLNVFLIKQHESRFGRVAYKKNWVYSHVHVVNNHCILQKHLKINLTFYWEWIHSLGSKRLIHTSLEAKKPCRWNFGFPYGSWDMFRSFSYHQPTPHQRWRSRRFPSQYLCRCSTYTGSVKFMG